MKKIPTFAVIYNEIHSMKKIGKVFTGVMLLTLMSTGTVLAAVEDLPVANVDGKLYFYYEVQPKETIYSLTHKLGVTVDEIIASNPSVADGLKAHAVLYFPVSEEALASGAGRKTHVVQRGETIYGISRQYGLTTDKLIEMNPHIKDGLKSGMELVVGYPPTGQSPAAAAVAAGNYHGYLVKDGETLYSIARENGVTVADLEAANPGMTVLKAGQILNIPDVDKVTVNAVTTPTGPQGSVTVETPVSTTIEAIEPPLAQTTVTETADEIITDSNIARQAADTRIAIMLPFMLNQSKMSRASARMLEFYKGFLIAADSLRDSSNAIKIYAFDTAAGSDSVKAVLARPMMKEMDVIIASDDASQLSLIGDFGRANKVAVLNPFVVKDTTYIFNPVMMQANIGHDLMYAKAIDAFVARLDGATPVFLVRNGGATDKSDFVDDLKKRFGADKIEWKEIKFNGKLAASNLADIKASGNYVFIPVSGKGAEFNSISDALVDLRDKAFAAGGSVRVWGYPEWIAFKGDSRTAVQNLDALIYSRFASDTDSFDAERVKAAYTRWYGGEMEPAVPSQGLLGFDTGMFLLRALEMNLDLTSDSLPLYRGVQNSYLFNRQEGIKGLENGALYIVNFRPSGIVESALLR